MHVEIILSVIYKDPQATENFGILIEDISSSEEAILTKEPGVAMENMINWMTEKILRDNLECEGVGSSRV